jgi:hypothetical protein
MRTAAVPARADYAADCSTASHRATMVIAHAHRQMEREPILPLARKMGSAAATPLDFSFRN